jgi:hypothetical protein
MLEFLSIRIVLRDFTAIEKTVLGELRAKTPHQLLIEYRTGSYETRDTFRALLVPRRPGLCQELITHGVKERLVYVQLMLSASSLRTYFGRIPVCRLRYLPFDFLYVNEMIHLGSHLE